MSKDADLIKSWRGYLGLTQAEFGEKVGVDRRSIHVWERDKHSPDPSTLRRVAEAIGIDYQDFLAGPEAYEKQRKAKGAAQIQPTPYVDLRLFHDVYLLSQLQEDLEMTIHVGYRSVTRGRDGRHYIYVVIDEEENQFFPKGSIQCVALDKPPQEGNIVLVWDNGGAYFTQWKEGFENKGFKKIFGPKVEG